MIPELAGGRHPAKLELAEPPADVSGTRGSRERRRAANQSRPSISVRRAVGRRVRDRLDELERGRQAFARRAWAETHDLLVRAHEQEPLDAQDLELLSVTVYMLGCDDDSVAWLERAHRRHLEDGETLRAVRSAAWIGLNLASRGDVGPASGWLGRAQRLVAAEGECAERGCVPPAPRVPARGHRRLRRVGRRRSGGRPHRRTLRRPRSLRARHSQPGSRTHQERSGGRRARAARRGHGRGDRGGALAHRHGDRLLRRHPRVPGGVRGAAGARVDAALADSWALQPEMVAFTGRASCTGRKSCNWTARGAARSRRRTAPRALRRDGNPAAGLARYREGELLRMQGDFPARRRRIGRRAPRVGTAPGSRPAAPRSVAPMPPSRLSGAQNRRRRSRSSARGCFPPSSRSCSRRGTSSPHVVPASSSRSSRPDTRARCSCDGRARGGAVHLAEGQARRRSSRCGRRGRRGTRSTPRTRSRARVCWWDACRLLGDEEAAVLEHERRRASSSASGEAGSRTVRGADDATGSRTASWRSCVSSPPAGRIARSPRRSSSASTPWRGTSRTSSRSSGSRPAPQRRRSPSSTTWSDAPRRGRK